MKAINHWKNKKRKNPPFSRTAKLAKNPHLKGVVFRVGVVTPKKPNSALRTVARVDIYKTKRRAICRIPGSGYLPNKFNRVLVEGGRANDLPRVRYTLRRGVYDFAPWFATKRRRSTYGIPRPEGLTTYIRKSQRKLGYV